MKISNLWHQLNQAQKDAIKATLLVAMLSLLALKFNLAETLAKQFESFENLQLDEFPFLLLFSSIALAWFARNRTREQKVEIERRVKIEKINEKLLAENKELTQHTLKVQELERLELARDLHDDIGQYLLAIRLDASILDASMLSTSSTKSTDNQEDLLELAAKRILSNAAHIQQMTRVLMRRLRPAPMTNQSCIDAIHLIIQEWREQQPNVSYELLMSARASQISLQDNIFSAQVSVAAYRLIQEALSNTVKHSNAKNVCVMLDIEIDASNPLQHYLMIEIKDNGVGIEHQTKSHGMGIIGMRERIASVNGDFYIGNNMPSGVTVSAKIPIDLSFSPEI